MRANQSCSLSPRLLIPERQGRPTGGRGILTEMSVVRNFQERTQAVAVDGCDFHVPTPRVVPGGESL